MHTTLLLVAAFGLASEVSPAELENRAASGDRDAIHALCYGYLNGEGFPKDPELAFPWCKKGAKLGTSSTQTLLAEMYRFGYFVKQDDEEAKRWYRAAAEQGHVHAQLMLGRLTFQYAKTVEDARVACSWFLTAADSGYEKAREQLEDLDRMWVEHYKGKPPRAHFCERSQ